jgi:ribosomal protein S18 acetylase RimI-like enzyme
VSPTFAAYRPGDGRRPDPAGLRLRIAKRGDCRSIAEIQHERDPAVDLEAAGTRCRADVRDPSVCLVVASIGDEICGFGRAARFEPAADAPADAAPAGWYLLGLIVRDRWRRHGIGARLTERRLDWIAERSDEAFYFVNARNRASLDLHERLGFREVTRAFSFPGATFQGGTGSLCRIDLGGRRPADDVRSRR